MIPEIDQNTFSDRLAQGEAFVLDVREAGGYCPGHVPGAQNVPLSVLPARLPELPRNQPIYVICQTGAQRPGHRGAIYRAVAHERRPAAAEEHPMTTVTALRRAAGAMTLADASRRFLRRDAFEPTARTAYGRTLAALADVVGADPDVAAVITEQLEDETLERWAATTYNRHRAALLSFFGWCVERGYTAADPAALVEARKVC